VGPAEFEVRETVAATAEPVPAPAPAPTLDPQVRIFDGRPVKPVRTIWMTVTAYSPDFRSCGKSADGVTASNKSVWTNGMRLAAADRRVLPFGTMISVPGYAGGDVIPVLDVGGAIKGKRLDLLYPTHSIARKWGVRKVPVTVWGYDDGAEAPAKSKSGASNKS
jgi:3D (Asp-Asp-Asp) domain-containing protein